MKTIQVEIPVEIKQGKSGLYFVTSPLVKGLLVSERTEVGALIAAQDAMRQLSHEASTPGQAQA